jgi:hypothetical protein
VCERPPTPSDGVLASLSLISVAYWERVRSLLEDGNVKVSSLSLEMTETTGALTPKLSVKLQRPLSYVDVSVVIA